MPCPTRSVGMLGWGNTLLVDSTAERGKYSALLVNNDGSILTKRPIEGMPTLRVEHGTHASFTAEQDT